MTDERIPERNDVRDELVKIALPFLVDRLGGDVLITESDYDDFMRRHAAHEPPSLRVERTAEGMRLSIPRPSN